MSDLARPSETAPARPRRRRWVAVLLGVVLTLLLLPPLLVGGALLYANTEGGRARLAGLAESFVPGLTLEGLSGPLPGRLGIARLTMADDQGVWLELEGARLDWDPRALLRREAHVNLLAAERLALHRLPASAPEAEPSEPGPLLPELPSLPLAVRLDRLELARIDLGEAVAGMAARLRAEGMAVLDASGLTAGLDVNAPEGATSLALHAALRPETGRLSAEIHLRDAVDGLLPRLIGQPGRPIELDLTLDGPAENAALTLRAALGPGLALDVAGTIRAPDMDRLGAELRGTADASGLLEGPLAALAGPLDLALDAGRMPDGAIDLRGLTVSGTAGRVAAQGRIASDFATAALRVQAALAGSDSFAALLPPGVAAWEGLDLDASIDGPLAAPVVDARLAARGFSSPQHPVMALLGATPRVTLRATAPDQIAQFTLAGAAIRAEASGRVAEVLDLRFAADLASVEGAAPGLLGALRLTGTATGPMADPSLTVQAASDRLEMAGQVLEALALEARIANPATALAVNAQASGRFQGQPLALDLRGAPQPDGSLRLDAATARFGPAELVADGVLDTATTIFTGNARLNVPDLAPLSAVAGTPLAGSLRAEAVLAGENGQQRANLRLNAPRLTASGTALRDIVAQVEGTLAELAFQLSGQVAEARIEARGRLAQQAEGVRRLDLATLNAASNGESLRLTAPARILLRPDGGIEVAALALTSGRGGNLSVAGSWSTARADLRANLVIPDLAVLAALLPDVTPSGRVQAEARITGPGTAPEIAATLRATGVRSNAAWARGLPAVEIQAEGRRGGDGAISGRATANAGNATRLTATANLPRGPEGPLEGSLDGTADLGALTAPLLAAGADRVAGRMTLALRVGGTTAAPVLGGQAQLAGGSYRNAVQGIALTQLAGTIAAEGPQLRLELNGRAGEGRVALTGTVAPLAEGMPVDLALRATGAQPVSSDLIRATLDAELALTGMLSSGARLSGPLRLRRADIRVPEDLPASVRSLGPVTEVGRVPGRATPPPRAPANAAAPAGGGGGLPIALDLQFIAPRGVFVRGRGLDAELGGTLAIRGTLDAPDISGNLSLVRGEFQILARRLTFSRGRLDFSGGLIPDLDFEAISQTGGTTVRANVSGPPSNPTITFSSTPELPQDEVLARLLFDRPVSELSPFEIAQIAQAIAGATGFAGGGASGVLDRVRQTLGLDRLAVGGGGETAARRTAAEERAGPTLEAGRYVADGVFVGVRQGTESGSSRVGVRVDLTPRIKLEAETGDREAGERVGVTAEWQWGR
ncbi:MULTISPECIES: translocation/assembly module TamB domain-containing protein [Roseomonadaceae]|uniref:Translocation/assembly module TamB domain-containing protein n=1 Tax=Falsiroseomonas oleicola TaxID=2801474 RepID=A0ABS6H938_9PROT|nr:translocation/assembly module TamB domain-containing protein [Roseomonas oleicola]MBU8545227.1 translocation/assembly module TamB domain-containing protein [Roseomonas oleicola]